MIARLVLALVAGLVVAGPGHPAHAEWTPATELRFQARLQPDTLTVGDPIVLEMSGSAPSHGQLLVPSFADSIGPFSILGIEELPASAEPEGRAGFARRVRLTAFRTGEIEAPPLPLLWVSAEGETLVAYSEALHASVRSVLPESLAAADPQTALAQLREVKGVVPLERSRLWMWILGGLLLAALLAWLLLWLLRRRRAAVRPPVPRVVPALPPEVAFHRGLDALLARRLVERGEFKEYYAELSLLLRRYIEGRFGLPAVEETQAEILASVEGDVRFRAADADFLRRWLAESDLVKFARQDRRSAEASRAAEEAAEWVLDTTRRREEQARAAARLAAGAEADAAPPSDASSAPPGAANSGAPPPGPPMRAVGAVVPPPPPGPDVAPPPEAPTSGRAIGRAEEEGR